MSQISELEFSRICLGIKDDAESIFEHNPIGPRDETLLWMLMSCLVSYLSLSKLETPCFTGVPDGKTYRNAIQFILNERKTEVFDADAIIEEMLSQ